MKPQKILSLILFILFALACNLPSNSPQPDNDFDAVSTYAAQTVAASIDPTGEQIAATTESPTAETIGQANSTPQPQQTSQAGNSTNTPCNRASFVEDVSIPDNTNLTVGKAFTKTWKLKNVGSCTWTSGYQIIFDSGDQMSGPVSQQLTNSTVLPGQTLDVSINLYVPNSPGTYKGNWRLKDPSGEVFALSTGPFWVQIKASLPADWPTYKKGDSGPEVYAIQYLLNYHGQTPAIDGIFGPETQNEVEDFQSAKGLKEDIIVGPETWQALIVTSKTGDTGNQVRAIQYLLKTKFGAAITVDGIFGPATTQAVKDFQTSKGIAIDGIVGPITWQKLIGN